MRMPAMCGLLLVMLLFLPALGQAAPIVADHEAVAQYEDIPDETLAQVRAMWLNVPGESHSYGYRLGLELLGDLDARFAVSVLDDGTPESATTEHLRVSRATWGDVGHDAGWRYGYGEEDWYTSSAAVARTKAHLDYAHSAGLPIAAMGFGWCWDMTWQNGPGGDYDPEYHVRWAGSSEGGPDGSLRWGLDDGDLALTGNHVSLDTYLEATQEYRIHAQTEGYDTVVFFTTGPVDGGGNTGEGGYQRHLKNERIRGHVLASPDAVLFDYADILCWSDTGDEQTSSWTDNVGAPHEFPFVHDDNMLDLGGGYAEDGDHIGQRGALRLGKALWWMLARLTGWDGGAGPDTDTDTGPAATDTEPAATDTGEPATDSGTPATDSGTGSSTVATDSGTGSLSDTTSQGETHDDSETASQSDSSTGNVDDNDTASSDCGCSGVGQAGLAASYLRLLFVLLG